MPKVLVIEDNLDIRENLEEVLELSDYQVLTAANGVEGVSVALAEVPDFIICDISMPLKNGYEVYTELSPFLVENKIPFIFLTASAQQSDIAKGKASGAAAYLTKPFQVDHLLQIIADLLESKK